MKQDFRPGYASYSSTPSLPTEVFHLENMDRDVDGFWRPRWGLKYLDGYAGDITHLSAHPDGDAVMLIYNGGNLAYWVSPSTKGNLDTGWPTSFVKAAWAPGANPLWLAHKAGVTGADNSLIKVDGSYSLNTVSGAPTGNWVANHNRVVFSIKNSTGIIRWSDYDDFATWPSGNDANKMPGSMTAEAIIDYGNNRSILFGQQGLTEVTGGSDDEISFAQLQNIAVAMPCHVITKCGDCIIFLVPGPRFVKFQGGRIQTISQPIAKDLRSYPSLTNLRCWHDAGRNYFCVTNLSTKYTHIYSVDEDRWLGFWTYSSDQGEPILGGASLTGANDQPYVLEFASAGERLCRWDSTLYKDEVDATPSNAVSFRCAIEAKPENSSDQRSLKRLRSIYADVAGSWTIYLKYRNTVDAAWTTVEWGTCTGPANITPPARYEFREWTLRAVANSASDVRFRSLSAEVQPVSEAKR